MRNRKNLWRLHTLGDAYGVRPSALLGIDDEWLAFQLDETVLIFGREMENEMSKASADERKRSLTDLFRMNRKPAQQFAPMKMPGIAKMKIPENGIW